MKATTHLAMPTLQRYEILGTSATRRLLVPIASLDCAEKPWTFSDMHIAIAGDFKIWIHGEELPEDLVE